MKKLREVCFVVLLLSVVQVAFAQLDQVDADRPIRPWLLGIAAHQIRNHRRNHRRKRKAIPVGIHEEIDQLLGVELEASGSSWQDGPVFEALDRCLTKLGSHGRELLRLRWQDRTDRQSCFSSTGNVRRWHVSSRSD